MFKLFQKTPIEWQKASLGLRFLVATISASAYVQSDEKLGFWLLVAGGILDFAIHLFTGEKEDASK